MKALILNTGMQLKYSLFTIWVVAFISLSHAQTAEDYFKKGNEAYASENYQEAVDAYTQAREMGQESAALYYNLGNANYKLNRIAPSIYNFERALELDPGDDDIRNNLAFAQNMTIDAITPLPQNTFNRWYQSILNLLSLDGWAIATVVFLLVFALSFIAYFFVFATSNKRLFFIGAFIALFLGIGSLFLSFKTQERVDNDRPAIVFSQQAEVRAEPKLSSDLAFTLHEGTKVLILKSDNDWQQIRLADGKEGWIPHTDIKEF